MQVVWANSGTPLNAPLGDFVSERVFGRKGSFRDFTAMGVAEDGKFVAALVYHNYDPDAEVVEISGAADTPRWLAKPVLWEMFNFPFNVIKAQTVVMRVDPADKRLSRILISYGFTKHILPRLRGRGKDEAVYILHDDVWVANGFHREKGD